MAPVVAVACSLEQFELPGFGPLPHHAVYERYVDALLTKLDVSPLLIPAVGHRRTADAASWASDYVALLDGLVLPGGAANIDPALYGARDTGDDPSQRDPGRDATVLPLIRAALRAGVPILGICRGMQELNVALGGTLIPSVHEVPGRRDHRSRKERAFSDRYDAAHPLHVAPGSWMERELVASGVGTSGLSVNSLHGQGVDRLGHGIVVEAWADDGTAEAIRVVDAPSLAIGVQWHLEWHLDTPLHAALFAAFGRACEARAAQRAGGMKRRV
jgi:putative glutamine amidotransferase